MRAAGSRNHCGAPLRICDGTGSRARKCRPPCGNRAPPAVRAASQPRTPKRPQGARAAQKRLVARHLLCSPYVGSMTPTRGVNMPLNLDQYVSVHAAALDVRARRTELIANNLANADTPGYKARDLDFRQAMARAAGETPTSGVHLVDHPGRPHRRQRLGGCRTANPGSQVPHAAGARARRQHRRCAARAGGLRRERRALPGDAHLPQLANSAA